MVEPSLCVLVSGCKILYSGGKKIVYDSQRYLVNSFHLPLECEVRACEQHPALGISSY